MTTVAGPVVGGRVVVVLLVEGGANVVVVVVVAVVVVALVVLGRDVAVSVEDLDGGVVVVVALVVLGRDCSGEPLPADSQTPPPTTATAIAAIIAQLFQPVTVATSGSASSTC